MTVAKRSFLVGMHSPLWHTATVVVGWVKLFQRLPSLKEFVCILFHDIGYLCQSSIDGEDNRHPELGARMCGVLFGRGFFNLCICHSRDYANRFGLPLSKLGYADKYSVLVYPNCVFEWLIKFGGEANEYHNTTTTRKWGYPIRVELIKADYARWVSQNTCREMS